MTYHEQEKHVTDKIQGQAGKRHLNTMFSATRINRLGRTAYASLTQVSITLFA